MKFDADPALVRRLHTSNAMHHSLYSERWRSVCWLLIRVESSALADANLKALQPFQPLLLASGSLLLKMCATAVKRQSGLGLYLRHQDRRLVDCVFLGSQTFCIYGTILVTTSPVKIGCQKVKERKLLPHHVYRPRFKLKLKLKTKPGLHMYVLILLFLNNISSQQFV